MVHHLEVSRWFPADMPSMGEQEGKELKPASHVELKVNLSNRTHFVQCTRGSLVIPV